MYYNVKKLRSLEKCRKHSLAARVFYISLLFSNDHRVLSQCNTPLRPLYLLNKEAAGECFLHFSSVFKWLECNTQLSTGPGFFICFMI